MNRTIVALATPPGIGGIAIIRLSGNESFDIIDKVFDGKIKIKEAKSHTIHYGNIVDSDVLIDKVTIFKYQSPNSYTGEDTIEIGCHGGFLLANTIINILIANGATEATPGEFTRRAFLNGKLDLTQVEAVADLIHSNSVAGIKTSARQLNGNFTTKLKELRKDLLDIAGLLELELDFADEGIDLIADDIKISKIRNAIVFCNSLGDMYRSSEIMRSGYFVGIVGFPNSGKSTLFNTLLQRHRAIVSDIAGTTRDYLEENILINDIVIRLIDTAGIRESDDVIEIEGVRLVDEIMLQSNLILLLNEYDLGANYSDNLFNEINKKYSDTTIIKVHNKIDKVEHFPLNDNKNIFISARNNTGIDELKQLIYNQALSSIDRESDILINQRHSLLLKSAAKSLETALEGISNGLENELISIDIRKSVKILGELTGEAWNEEVLAHIFSHFCIGK